MYRRKKYVKTSKDDSRDIAKQIRSNKGTNEAPKRDVNIQDGISAIAMKDLPKSSYAIKADPYTELNQASHPYDFITRFNSKYQASYKGNENIDGGYVSQFLTAKDSRLLNVYDTVKMEVSLNYRYLNISHKIVKTVTPAEEEGQDPVTTYAEGGSEPLPVRAPQNYDIREDYRGSQILRKMYDAVNEAVSQLDATTFTYLAMNTSYSVLSTLKIPGVQCLTYYVREVEDEDTHVKTSTEVYCYTDVAAVILLSSIEYQCILQSGLAVLKQINKYKNNIGTLVKMNYQREIGPLNQFHGLLNKAAFIQLLTSIQINIMGEYVDADWARNTNILTQLVSRKADDMIDPLMEINGVYNLQDTFVMVARANGKWPLADSDPAEGSVIKYSDVESIAVWLGGLDPDNDSRTATVIIDSQHTDRRNVSQIVGTNNKLLSPCDSLGWSRNSTASMTPTDRYNRVVYNIEGMDKVLTELKTHFGDLRTIYDKLAPLGIINYIKGVTVDITKDFNVQPVDYMLIDDVFRTVLSGNDLITFSGQTGRWTGFSLWNKYTGIPLYDSKSGGAFLSFCTKRFDLMEHVRTDYSYLPVMFTALSGAKYVDEYVTAYNRLGDKIKITPHVLDHLDDEVGVSRLAILPNFDNYDFKAPTHDEVGTFSQIEKDYIKFLCLNLADAYYESGDQTFEVNNDIVAIYNYEIEPIEKSMITYAKAFGPCKGVTDADADMGFAGLSSIKTK